MAQKYKLNLTYLLLLALTLTLTLAETPTAQADNSEGNSDLWLYQNAADFSGWQLDATKVDGDSLKLNSGSLKRGSDPYGANGYQGRNYYNGGSYSYGEALAPYHAPFRNNGFTSAVVSWNAGTPSGTWVVLKLRALVGNRWTKEYVMGVWASDNGTIQRHSVDNQADADGKVMTDTLVLNSPASAYQLRAILFTTDPNVSPTLKLAAVSATRKDAPIQLSPRLWGRDLSVPERSQMIYPDGGEVWCSPTSTSMVLAYWGQQTGRGDLDQTVPSAAARTLDWVYRGNGNWPFNAAYAASFGLNAYVSRFETLSQTEYWIDKGIPVIASIAYRPGDLGGTPIPQSDGHLLVIRGFDNSGNVIVNDPAADPRKGQSVRMTYNRGQFEKVWQNGSGGAVYLIYPKDRAIPALPDARLRAWPDTRRPHDFADPSIAQTWNDSDSRVTPGNPNLSWVWGPQPNTAARLEAYAEGPDGQRLVQYFDKSRMEITKPNGDRNSPWFVTNGLLTVELVSGKIQTGDNRYQDAAPAQIPVAGDPDSPQAPTYATFNSLASLPGTGDARRAPNKVGQYVTSELDRNGQSRQIAPPASVKLASYDQNLGHNLPDIFLNWLENPQNKLWGWAYVMGYPIAEPYWVTVNLQGKPTTILVQLFERRVLTYNPANAPAWQIEMGNIGQHYYRWRYNS